MANTIIKIPYLTAGLTYTVDVVDPDTDTVLQSGIVLTLSGETGTGTVTAAVDQRAEFVVRHNGNRVESVPRVRSISDNTGPWRIVTGLDTLSDTVGGLYSALTLSADENFTTLFGIAFDEFGNPEDGVPVTIQCITGDGTAGVLLDTQPRIAVSATETIAGESIEGYFEFPGVRIGTTWSVVRGTDPGPTNGFGTPSGGASGSVLASIYPSQPITQVLGQEEN